MHVVFRRLAITVPREQNNCPTPTTATSFLLELTPRRERGRTVAGEVGTATMAATTAAAMVVDDRSVTVDKAVAASTTIVVI